MSASRAWTLTCDECWTVYDDEPVPTKGEVERKAKRQGWTKTGSDSHLCAECTQAANAERTA